MLTVTLRAARPLRIRAQIPTLRRQAHPSAPFTTRIPSTTRPSVAASAPCGHFQTVFHARMSTRPSLQSNKVDRTAEGEAEPGKLDPRPDEATSSSSVRQASDSNQAAVEPPGEMLTDLKNDLNTVKETFALGSVPRQAYTLGLAGTLPYLATSVSTVFLSWNLNTPWPSQSMFLNHFLFNHESAQHWLQILEPIQIAYGAVIISFLGAIHWGLELAEKQPLRGRTQLRYGLGVLAPIVAWPTMFMPTVWALTTQFGAFCALYYADSRSTVKGWTPAWYGTYRFVLTAVVGVAILISLVGRAKVGEGHTRLSTAELQDRIRGTSKSTGKYHNWEKEEQEEKDRVKKEKKQEERERAKAEKKQEEKGEKKAKGDGKSGDENKQQVKDKSSKEGGKTTVDNQDSSEKEKETDKEKEKGEKKDNEEGEEKNKEKGEEKDNEKEKEKEKDQEENKKKDQEKDKVKKSEKSKEK